MKIIKPILSTSFFLILIGHVNAQISATGRAFTNITVNLLESDSRSIRDWRDSTDYKVSADGQAVYATRKNKLIWEVWPFEQYPIPYSDDSNFVGKLEIRLMTLEPDKLSIVAGKHCYYEILLEHGYLRHLGCD